MASPCHRAIGLGAIGWALGVASVALLAVVFGAGSFVAAAVVVVMGSSWTASLASVPDGMTLMLTIASGAASGTASNRLAPNEPGAERVMASHGEGGRLRAA